KNGTILAGRTLLGEEAETHDGDSLQDGVLGFSLQILSPTSMAGQTDYDPLPSWLIDQASSADPDAPTAFLIPTQSDPSSPSPSPQPSSVTTETPDDDPNAAHADPNLSTNALACEIVRGILVA